jgi:hypothetical protein
MSLPDDDAAERRGRVIVGGTRLQTQTAEVVPRRKWKMIETTANIRRMWIKKAVTWNMKKPPSHSRSKTNPRTRNIVRLFLPIDV